MTSADRRRELREQYEQRRFEAGVYVLRNRVTGRILLASTVDLASVRNRLAFGRETGSTGVLDRRLVADAREHGIAAFEFEVLDVVEVKPAATPDDIRADVEALEALWRERLADAPHY